MSLAGAAQTEQSGNGQGQKRAEDPAETTREEMRLMPEGMVAKEAQRLEGAGEASGRDSVGAAASGPGESAASGGCIVSHRPRLSWVSICVRHSAVAVVKVKPLLHVVGTFDNKQTVITLHSING